MADPSDSGSTGNNKIYKCIECFKPFSNRAMLIQHQREDEPCRNSLKIIQQNKPQPALGQPLILLSSLSSPPRIIEANTSSLVSSPSVVRRNNEAENESRDNTFCITNLRSGTMQIDGYDDCDDDHLSPNDRTLDLISQLDPTRNLLQLIDKQSAGPSTNATNVVDAAPGRSENMGTIDLNFTLSMV